MSYISQSILGLGLCIVAFIPTVIWIVNTLMSRTTDTGLLLASAPLMLAGLLICTNAEKKKPVAEDEF